MIKAPRDKRHIIFKRATQKLTTGISTKIIEAKDQWEESLQVKDKKMSAHLGFFSQWVYPLKLANENVLTQKLRELTPADQTCTEQQNKGIPPSRMKIISSKTWKCKTKWTLEQVHE